MDSTLGRAEFRLRVGGARLRSALASMRQVWSGELRGQGGDMRRLPADRPALLFGGLVSAAYTRAAIEGHGWVAPLFGLPSLTVGARAVREAWDEAGRHGEPRIVTGRYFSLGKQADHVADVYIRHYYGDAYFPLARADTLTSRAQIQQQRESLIDAGVTDLVLFPCSGEVDQVQLLADALLRE